MLKVNMKVTVVPLLNLVCVLGEISNLGNKEFNEDENRRLYNTKEAVMADSSSDNQNSANHFTDTLPGDPQQDYPTYAEIPRTGFSCKGKVNWHYYADINAACQAFHVCETEYSKISFLCPTGSVFNQRHLVCDWWYNVDCNDSESLYALSNDDNDPMLSVDDVQGDRSGFDLGPAEANSHQEEKIHNK